ncbi:MAG: hypothetical protein ACK567_13960, partial [Chitinophagales bacterium]
MVVKKFISRALMVKRISFLKKWTTPFFLLFLFSYNNFCAQQIINTTYKTLTTGIHLCRGINDTIKFDTVGSFAIGTVFTVQLSDSAGGFGAPTTIGTSSSTKIPINIPALALSNTYSLRVIKLVSPTIIGDTLKIITLTKPTLNFTITNNNTCPGTSVGFNSTSSGVGTLVYAWTFNSATPSSSAVQNPSGVIYPPTIGNTFTVYPVKLIVTDGYGCKDSIIKNDTVKHKPQANLNLHPPTTGNFSFVSPNTFTRCNASSPYILTITNFSTSTNTKYFINWGDSTTNYDTTASFTGLPHTYTNVGLRSLTHIVTNSNGCQDTQKFGIYIGSNPSISMPSPGGTIGQCSPKSYTFSISGFASNTPGTTYKIESNDKGVDTNFNHPPPSSFTKTYNNHSCGYTSSAAYPNSFNLKITASNSCGSSTQTIEPIQISTKPKANFSISPDTIVCVNNDLVFTNTSIRGKYINSSNSCDTSNFIEWAISPSTGWSVISGTMSGFSPLPTNTIRIRFNTVGVYNVKFDLYNNASPCGRDTIVKSICVHPQSIPRFTFTQAPLCKNSTVTITNLSNTLTNCGITNYVWSVLDSITNTVIPSGPRYSYTASTNSTSIHPVFLFTQAGKYKIRLTLTNKCGTLTKDSFLTVKDVPAVSFSSSSYCDSQTIKFTPTYLANNGTISAYNWTITPAGSNFVLGSSSSANPTIFFPLNTTTLSIVYKVKVTATNECGMSPVDSQTVTIFPRPSISNAGPTQLICNATTTLMSANTPTVGTGVWAKVTGPAGDTIAGISNPLTSITGLNSTNNPSVYVYSWTISQTACPPSVSFDTIKVYPPTNSGTIASSATVCSGINSGNLSLSGKVGSVLRWEFSSAPFVTWTNISNTTTSQNYTNLSQTRQYRVVVQNGSACSIVNSSVVTITVNDTTFKILYDTTCRNKPKIFNGISRNTSGLYRDTLVNSKNCDSFIYYYLTVNDTSKKDSFRTICKNQSVVFNGISRNTAGIYKDTLTNSFGCDSFVYLHLTVNDTSTRSINQTICKNQPIIFNGISRNVSGIYRDTLVNAAGCDSFIYLNLTVKDTSKKDSFRIICRNKPITFNGMLLNANGIYKDTLVNARGCDSFVYLHLTVNNTSNSIRYDTTCRNLPKVFNNQSLNTNGMYRDTMVNAAGCDSFIYYFLHIKDTTKKDSFKTICKNNPIVFNGISRSTTGIYKDTLFNSAGCDSFIYLHLTVNDTTKKDSFLSICKYNPIVFNGISRSVSGIYRDTFQNAAGCDSFFYLHLTVNDSTKKDSFLTICGNKPITFNGMLLNVNGVYKDTLVNTRGCDSFVYLHLIVNDTSNSIR